MKHLIVLMVGLAFVVHISVAQSAEEALGLSEPVERGENYRVYGSPFPEDAQFFALGYLVRNSNVFDGQTVATKGTIKEVDQKKGRFFILTSGDEQIRVTFKDATFAVPNDAAGAKVRLTGVFKVKELTEKYARYTENTGESPEKWKPVAKEKAYKIVATSVKVMGGKKE